MDTDKKETECGFLNIVPVIRGQNPKIINHRFHGLALISRASAAGFRFDDSF